MVSGSDILPERRKDLALCKRIVEPRGGKIWIDTSLLTRVVCAY